MDFEDSIQEDFYKLIDCHYRKDTVVLTIANSVNELRIIVSIDSFVKYGLRMNQIVDNDLITTLLKEELYINAYLGCIRKLTYKDRTIKEIRDYLEDEYTLDEAMRNELIEELLRKRYLDDTRYAESYVLESVNRFFGSSKVRKDLLAKGINEEIINEAINTNPQDEDQMAFDLAKRMQAQLHHKSIKAKKQKIKEKLIENGYGSEQATQAIDKLNFVEERDEEMISLRLYAERARLKYSRKYKDYELRNRIFRYLYSQGFEYDDIYVILNEMGWEENE